MHKRYVFSHLTGTFIYNEHCRPIKEVPFGKNGVVSEHEMKKLEERFKGIDRPDPKALQRILADFKTPELFPAFVDENLIITKKAISSAASEDQLIIQAVKSIKALERASSTVMKSLREWFSLISPETEHAIDENEVFIRVIMDKKQRLTPMGVTLSQKDMQPIRRLAEQVSALRKSMDGQEDYLEQVMRKLCPNLATVAGPVTGAKLIELAGSLKHLATIPASTVQLLGAEEALFRHMIKGTRCPKYGIIYSHDAIQKADKDHQGRMARALADKITIAVKIDYFKGDFIGDRLREEVYAKLK